LYRRPRRQQSLLGRNGGGQAAGSTAELAASENVRVGKLHGPGHRKGRWTSPGYGVEAHEGHVTELLLRQIRWQCKEYRLQREHRYEVLSMSCDLHVVLPPVECIISSQVCEPVPL
jgi:hypothetical protein